MKHAEDILKAVKIDSPTKGKIMVKESKTPHSLCTVCNTAQNDDMVECETCKTWIHYECDIDNILEDEEEKVMYICPPCRKLSHEKTKKAEVKGKADSTIRTRAATRKETASQSKLEDNLNQTFIVNTDTVLNSEASENRKVDSSPKLTPEKLDKIENALSRNKSCSYFLKLGSEAEYENSSPNEWMDDDNFNCENYLLQSNTGWNNNSISSAVDVNKEKVDTGSDLTKCMTQQVSDQTTNDLHVAPKQTPQNPVIENHYQLTDGSHSQQLDSSETSQTLVSNSNERIERSQSLDSLSSQDSFSSTIEAEESVVEVQEPVIDVEEPSLIQKIQTEENVPDSSLNHDISVIEESVFDRTPNEHDGSDVSNKIEQLCNSARSSQRYKLLFSPEAPTSPVSLEIIPETPTVVDIRTSDPATLDPSPNNIPKNNEHSNSEKEPRNNKRTRVVAKKTAVISKGSKRNKVTLSKLQHKNKEGLVNVCMKQEKQIIQKDELIKSQCDMIAELKKKVADQKTDKERIDNILQTAAAMKDKPIDSILAEKQKYEIQARNEIANLMKKVEDLTKSNTKKQSDIRKHKETSKSNEERIDRLENQIEVEIGNRKRIEEMEKIKSEKCQGYENIVKQYEVKFNTSEEELRKLRFEISKRDDQTNEIQRLEASNKKLSEEIINLATCRVREIEKSVNSSENEEITKYMNREKAHGIPNVNRNMCFISSSLHLLSTGMPQAVLKKCNGETGKILNEVVEHLQGRRTFTEADDLAWKIWEEAAKKWPQYASNDRGFSQEDATEYLLRVLCELHDESRNIEDNMNTSLDQIRHCIGKSCKTESYNKLTEYIPRTRELPSGITIDMQHLVDRYLLGISLVEGDRCPDCQSELTEDTLVEKAPQIMMIHVNRVRTDDVRSSVKVQIPDRNILVRRRGQSKQLYQVVATLVHYGSQSENGHYVTNYFDEQEKSWFNINDEKIIKLSNKEAAKINEDTVVVVLKRISADGDQPSSVQRRKLCQWYLKGYCKFGDRCYNEHKQSVADKPVRKQRTNSVTIRKPTKQNIRSRPRECWYYNNSWCKYGYQCHWEHKLPPLNDPDYNHQITSEKRANYALLGIRQDSPEQAYQSTSKVPHHVPQSHHPQAYQKSNSATLKRRSSPGNWQWQPSFYTADYQYNERQENNVSVNKPTVSKETPEAPPSNQSHSNQNQSNQSKDSDCQVTNHLGDIDERIRPWHSYSRDNPYFTEWKNKNRQRVEINRLQAEPTQQAHEAAEERYCNAPRSNNESIDRRNRRAVYDEKINEKQKQRSKKTD